MNINRIVDRILFYFIKYWPVMGTIALLISVTSAFVQGQSSPIIKLFFGYGLLLNAYVGLRGWRYRLCNWHRVLIINLMLGSIFFCLNSMFFGLVQVTIYRIILLINSVSILVVLMLYFKYGCFRINNLNAK